ncbi:MAG: hypothetical protein HZA54_15085 [Planctomycetes bacterium]|nr:hypothetical protein [Planctomycetota bacterium]
MPDLTPQPVAPPSGAARICAFFEILGAAILVGGLAATAAIGVTAFSSTDILSHELAGRLMARVFEGAEWVQLGAIAVILLAMFGRVLALRAVGRPPRIFMRLLPLLWMLVLITVVGEHKLIERMRTLRAAHGGTLAAVAADDPDRVEFGQAHRMYAFGSVTMMVLGVGLLAYHALREEA